MQKNITFDVESSPCPLAEAERFMPSTWPTGNTKDPDKLATAIAEKKKAWLEDGALNPLTARVLAIGLLVSDTFVLIGPPATEAEILHEFWDAVRDGDNIHKLIGFNVALFDLPLLCRSSYRLGVPVPSALREGRYWSRSVIDLRDLWTFNDRQTVGSLDTVAKYFGVGAKTGSGTDFSNLWQTDRPKAEAYLKNDISITAAIARKLGVL